MPRLRYRDPGFGSLIGRAPERGPDGHGCNLSIAALPGPGFAGHLVLLGQPRVERSAEVHVARTAARGDQDTLPRRNVHRAALVRCRDAKHPARGGALSNDARHLVPQKDLRALRPRTGFQRPDETGSNPGRMMRYTFAGDGPLDGSLLSTHRRGTPWTHQVVLKLDPIFDQEFEGRRVLVRKRAYEVPVTVPALTVVVAYPVQEHLVRRILHPVLPLIARAATKVDIPPEHMPCPPMSTFSSAMITEAP